MSDLARSIATLTPSKTALSLIVPAFFRSISKHFNTLRILFISMLVVFLCATTTFLSNSLVDSFRSEYSLVKST